MNVVLGELHASGRPSRNADPAEPNDGISGEILRNLQLDLEKAVSTLPKQARAVFVLHDVEGWKHEEIAEFMGIAVGTCKAQLARARKLLREVLGT